MNLKMPLSLVNICSAVLNPHGQYYKQLTLAIREEYEDNYWAEDAIYMERNSRDFVSRSERINQNSNIVCQMLQSNSLSICILA